MEFILHLTWGWAKGNSCSSSQFLPINWALLHFTSFWYPSGIFVRIPPKYLALVTQGRRSPHSSIFWGSKFSSFFENIIPLALLFRGSRCLYRISGPFLRKFDEKSNIGSPLPGLILSNASLILVIFILSRSFMASSVISLLILSKIELTSISSCSLLKTLPIFSTVIFFLRFNLC